MLTNNQIVMLLVDLVVIIVAARLLGRVAVALGQPAVVGEIAAGILAGPAVIGTTASAALFPADVQQHLTAFADVGIALFMFQAGLEIDRRVFVGNTRLVAAVSAAAYVLPFLLGVLVAVTLLARHDGGHRVAFACFMGAALAVTAFPVLARILADRGMLGSRIGQLSLAAAAVNDLFAWTVLGVLVGVVNPHAGGRWHLALVVPLLVAIGLTRKALLRIDLKTSPSTETRLVTIAISGALLCGAATEWVGLHPIFGAFAFGVAFPRGHRELVLARTRLVSSLFLPAFFVTAGLKVDFAAIDGQRLLELAAIILAAVLGKFGGSYAAARLCAATPRDSGTLASLMNARGLTELVILVVGLSLGLIGKDIYSLMVIAALVTTAMTTPLLRLFEGRDGPEPEPLSVAAELDTPAVGIGT